MTELMNASHNSRRSASEMLGRAPARRLGRALVLGAAGAALVASLAGPAAARAIVIPTVPADLQMEKFEVTDVGNGFWNLKATLRNGGSNPPFTMKTYPGGGKLRLKRGTGGMTPLAAPFLFASVPDPIQTLAERTIPSLKRGEATTLEVWSKGRAVFYAVAEPASIVPDSSNSLPEVNTANNSKVVNKLKAGQFNVSTSQLQQYLNSVAGQIQIHLNKSDAFAKLPGFYESHWNIADAIRDDVLPEGAAHWSMQDVNIQSAFVSMGAGGRLIVTLTFETGGAELNGHQEPGPDNVVPDLNASPVTATVQMPLQFNAQFQYLFCGQPQVTVEADLATPWPAQPWVATDFRSKVKNAVTDLFNYTQVSQKIAYEINRQIKQQAVPNGRIVSADYNASYIKLHTEVP
jgi:hypothetical protein